MPLAAGDDELAKLAGGYVDADGGYGFEGSSIICLSRLKPATLPVLEYSVSPGLKVRIEVLGINKAAQGQCVTMDVLSQIRLCSTALTPVKGRPSAWHIDCRVLLTNLADLMVRIAASRSWGS